MNKAISLFEHSPTFHPNLTPKQLLFQHKIIARKISENTKKLKNPINTKTNKPLKPITMRHYERQLKSDRRKLKISCKIIKQMRHYNLLEKSSIEYPFDLAVFNGWCYKLYRNCAK